MVLDGGAIVVSTADPTFAGQTIAFEVLVEQDVLVETRVVLQVEVSFDLEPATFDTTGFSISPLSCTEEELANWSL